ncbi:MAG TPA: hypothetical protein ENI65_02150 [Gammaproteobacteria bacterium]|nr:hypothetical protein [Gammaproteobacteria bacterium]
MTAITRPEPKNPQLLLSLKRASTDLGIDIETPFSLDLPCGCIEADALVKDFGYECGVVINVNTRETGDLYKHLADFGYGVATLSVSDCDAGYDSTKWKILCREWGWKGKGNPPDWY